VREFLMGQKIKNILAAVTSDTLEKLAFLFVFPDEERDSDGPRPVIVGRVEFNGFFSGSLVLRMSSSVLAELSANMLGVDDDAVVSHEDQQDAFKEMLNVICGNLLPAIAGDHVVFNIKAPEIILEEDTKTEMGEENPMCVERLTVEDGFCDVYLFIKGKIPDIVVEDEVEEIQ
jgi:chemotaxis protein CheY-P-specific phosphatase CheC